jgi:predicted GIY-YIG superfamily endonuclease
MYYLYMLGNQSTPKQRYIGYTADLRGRLRAYNEEVLPNTARYRPWGLATYLAFSSKRQALAFERYLETGLRLRVFPQTSLALTPPR